MAALGARRRRWRSGSSTGNPPLGVDAGARRGRLARKLVVRRAAVDQEAHCLAVERAVDPEMAVLRPVGCGSVWPRLLTVAASLRRRCGRQSATKSSLQRERRRRRRRRSAPRPRAILRLWPIGSRRTTSALPTSTSISQKIKEISSLVAVVHKRDLHAVIARLDPGRAARRAACDSPCCVQMGQDSRPAPTSARSIPASARDADGSDAAGGAAHRRPTGPRP